MIKLLSVFNKQPIFQIFFIISMPSFPLWFLQFTQTIFLHFQGSSLATGSSLPLGLFYGQLFIKHEVSFPIKIQLVCFYLSFLEFILALFSYEDIHILVLFFSSSLNIFLFITHFDQFDCGMLWCTFPVFLVPRLR